MADKIAPITILKRNRVAAYDDIDPDFNRTVAEYDAARDAEASYDNGHGKVEDRFARFREFVWNKHAPVREEALRAAQTANAAAHACAAKAAYATDATATTAATAAYAAAYAAKAAKAKARDRILSEFAEDVVGILEDMEAPGCQWLDLTEPSNV